VGVVQFTGIGDRVVSDDSNTVVEWCD